MIKATTKLALSAALLVALGNVHASPFKYNYTEVQIIKPDTGVLNNGFGVNVSYDVLPNYNILGSYHHSKRDNPVFDRDSDQFTLGIGYHDSLNKATDFTSSLYVLHQKTDTTVKVNDNFKRKDSDTGLGVQVGLRRVLSQDTDGMLNIGVRHINGYEDGYANISIEYHMSEELSVGAKYQFDNDINSATAMVRYEF